MIYTFVPILSAVGNFAIVGGIAYLSLLAFTPVFWVRGQSKSLLADSRMPRAAAVQRIACDLRAIGGGPTESVLS